MSSDFSALYSQHLDFVWRNLRALGVPAADLDDATQDTFVVAYRRRDDFRPDASLRAWLYSIARRVASKQRRGGGRRTRLVEALAAQPIEQPSPDTALAQRDAWRTAMACLDGLPAAQREAYWLTEVEGLTAAEAGSAVGVSANTISSRLRIARQALARHGEVLRAREAGVLERALRRHSGPTAAQHRRAAAALAVRLSTMSTLASGLVPWVAAAALVVIVGGATTLANEAEPMPSPPEPVASSTESPSPRPHRPAPPLPVEPVPSTVPAVVLPPARPRPSPSPKAKTGPSMLAQESALVRRIKSAVVADPSRALSLAAEHGRRFPHGVLEGEATALRVQAACALGRDADAARFAKSLPPTDAWASGCPSKENLTNPTSPGD